MGFFGGFNKRIGIDLGTTNTLIYVENHGIVLREPSVIAIDQSTNLPVAVGSDAWAMLGRTHSGIRASRPLRDGVIAELREATCMLKEFLKRVSAQEGALRNPEIVIAIPAGITSVERIAIQEIAESAKASRIYMPYESMCAAIGSKQPVTEAIGSMIVDIGGGTTEVAVISLSGIVVSESIGIAGDEIDQAIRDYVKTAHGLEIGQKTAEALKMRWSLHGGPDDNGPIDVLGLNIANGVPKTVSVCREEIRRTFSFRSKFLFGLKGGKVMLLQILDSNEKIDHSASRSAVGLGCHPPLS